MYKIRRQIVTLKNEIEFYTFKRFAGHSKWQNIRHIKAEKDAEKSSLYNQFTRRMKVAITEVGNARPEQNVKLAKIIQEAKKACMPNDSINSFLKRAQSAKENSKIIFVTIRAPGSCYILLQILSSNPNYTKILLNSICNKMNYNIQETIPKGIFQHKGVILTKSLKSIDFAIEDAIICDAEEVEEIDDDGTKLLQFTCAPTKVLNVRSELEKLNYEIIKAEDEYQPLTLTSLNEEQEQSLEKFYKRLDQIDEVVKIYTNIA